MYTLIFEPEKTFPKHNTLTPLFDKILPSYINCLPHLAFILHTTTFPFLISAEFVIFAQTQKNIHHAI